MQTLPFAKGDPSALRAAGGHAAQAYCPHCGAARAGDLATRAATPCTAQLPDTTAVAPAQPATHRPRSGEPPQHIAPWQCPILRAALLGTIALVLLVVDMFVLWPVP